MARNPLIIKRVKQPVMVRLNQSAGILDDHAVRKNVATKEGTIEQVPTEDNHIANKLYVDLQVASVSGDLNTTYNAGAPVSLVATTFSMPASDTSTDGYLGSADWNTFNNKADSDSDTTYNATAPVDITGTTISMSQSDSTTNGYLSSTDWGTFNNKADSDSDTTYSATAPILLTGTAFSMPVANTSTNGYLSSTDWNTFNVGADTDHAALTNLTYASAGHTGFVASASLVTLQSEVDAKYSTAAGTFNLTMPDNTEHPFYLGQNGIGYLCCNTETGNEYIQMGCAGTSSPIFKVKLGSTAVYNDFNVTGNISVTGNVDGVDVASRDALLSNVIASAHSNVNDAAVLASTHPESHTVVSHSDTTVTGAQLNAVYASAHSNSLDHTQNTDTILGASAVSLDHGTAATDMIVNVCYGTSATPPTASTTTEGALYIQYTA